MNKSPAFQFYPDKWQSHTRRLSDSSYRVYHEIICWMWQHSPDQFSICQDVEGIACSLAIEISIVERAIREIQNIHAPLFKTEGTNFISNGLRKEAEKQTENREKRAKAANVRWDAEHKKCTSNANASIVQCSLSLSPIPSPSPILITKESSNIVDSSEPTKPKKKSFEPPTLDLCLDYGKTISMSENQIDAFFNSKESNGWMVGRNKMKCWKAGMRYWKSQEKINAPTASKPKERQTWEQCKRKCGRWDDDKKWCTKFEKEQPKDVTHCYWFNN